MYREKGSRSHRGTVDKGSQKMDHVLGAVSAARSPDPFLSVAGRFCDSKPRRVGWEAKAQKIKIMLSSALAET